MAQGGVTGGDVSAADFQRRFDDPGFALETARGICREHGIAADPARVITGSNLVFRAGDDLWLKLFPAVNEGEFSAELWMLQHVANRLPVATPRVVAHGERDRWDYALVTHVGGIAFDVATREMDMADRVRIATDLGVALAALHALPIDGFPQRTPTWPTFLARQRATAAERARASGADERWTGLVRGWMERHGDELAAADADVLVHADLYFDHLLVSDRSGRWEISGFIDFADTVIAPVEYELVDPVLWLFRAEPEPLAAMLTASGYDLAELDATFAERMLAWALVHRFTRFANAFRVELEDDSIRTMEALARRILPLR